MATEEKQVNEAQFLKNLNKHKAAASAAAKVDRPTGILDDAAIMARLGLDQKGMSVTLNGRVSKIQFAYAKEDTTRPYFRFAYSLSEDSPNTGKGKGTIVSNYHELTEASKNGEVWRTVEQAYEHLYGEFQGLGDVTKDWKDPLVDAVKAAKKHTADKTEIQLNISTFERANGNLGVNYRVVNAGAPADNSDLETEESEESEEEGSYEDWIGGWVTWTDDDGSVDFLIESFDTDNSLFCGKDEEDNEYEAPVDQCEWCDNQRED